MAPFGYFLIAFYVGLLFLKDKKTKVFIAFFSSCILSLFFTTGLFCPYLPYSLFSQCVFLLFFLFFGDLKTLPNTKLPFIGFFLLSINISLLLLYSGITNVGVLPLHSNYDQLAVNGESVQDAFSLLNVKYCLQSVILCCYLYFGFSIFSASESRKKLVYYLYRTCLFIFVFLLCEFLFVNAFHWDVHAAINAVFGKTEATITNLGTRGGFVPSYAFWSEPAAVCHCIIFIFIQWCLGIKSWKSLAGFFLSLFGMMVTLSTTGLIMMSVYFVSTLVFAFCQKDKYSYIFKGFPLIILFTAGAITTLFVSGLATEVWQKITAYMGQGGSGSGLYRGSVNKFVWKQVFLKVPLFGAGIGSCNSHGALPGIFANIGIIGFAAWFIMLFVFSNCKLTFQTCLRFAFLMAMSLGTYLLSNSVDPVFACLFFGCSLSSEDADLFYEKRSSRILPLSFWYNFQKKKTSI
jgi:hypothetical protein